MLKVANELRQLVERVLPELGEISDDKAALESEPGKWTRKEVLGHLIDSACNNQQKFVRTMDEDGLEFPGYKQDFWIASQKYNSANWSGLLALWHAYNLHIAHIIEHVDPKLLSNSVTIDDHGTFTLEFIMKDYLDHMKHHLLQILPKTEGAG